MQDRTFGKTDSAAGDGQNLVAVLGLAALVLVPLPLEVFAQTIEFRERDAVVWLQEQMVIGVATNDVSGGDLFVNGDAYEFDIVDGRFAVPIHVEEGQNAIVACTSDGSTCSDTLRWELGYQLHPEPFIEADVAGRTVTLNGAVLENPTGTALSFRWEADIDNPAATSITVAGDSTATVTIPTGAPPGEYYFDVVVEDAEGNEGKARTFVTVDSIGIEPFDIRNDHSSWIDEAIVYEVTPYIFQENGKWRHVTARLGEIAALGVNTLWIQPVFEAQSEGPGTSGQGYGITDYFRVRPDLGTAAELRELVRSAKEDYGMRVLFDFVPNHTSIEHRYAQDVIAHGTDSHYYDWYLTEPDNAPYSQHYERSTIGPFLYYFWDRLVIIDWSNPEVYRWMMEAGRTWIQNFDIDGYRIDAVWGVNARTPEAMQNWRFDLKRLKPEILLLGEDKATWPSSFEGRFDVAYDWYPEEGWVSHWTWQTDFDQSFNRTIFNDGPEGERSALLRRALTNDGRGWHPEAKVFRFMENNDTFRFIDHHGLARTKMAAALLFALPGVPLIYNGQEIGSSTHPYATWRIFRQGTPIRDQDSHGLYPYYKRLTEVRLTHPALTGNSWEEIRTAPALVAGYIFAFRRWEGEHHAIVALNMANRTVNAAVELSSQDIKLDASTTYYLTDLVTGESYEVAPDDLPFISIPMPAYTARIMGLADHVLEVPTSVSPDAEMPGFLALEQNYPNPFNPSTTIGFTLPRAGAVRMVVYDVLGREITILLDDELTAGRYEVRMDASRLPNGIYFYRLTHDGVSQTKRMILMR